MKIAQTIKLVTRWLIEQHSSSIRVVLAVIVLGTCIGRSHAAANEPLLATPLQSTLPATIARIKPAIVAVGTYLPTRNPGFQFCGTGFAVADGTLIATNSHVVQTVIDTDKKEVFSIALPQANGEALLRQASVVARDVEHDLILLRIEGAALPVALTLADSDRIRAGESYAFTGFPLGSIIGLFAATHSALIAAVAPMVLPQPTSRQLDAQVIRKLRSPPFNVVQLDATAYPGSSGSPLFDPATGEVVAIVNMVLMSSDKDSAVARPSGIAYAVPVNFLREMLDKQGLK